MPTENHAAVTLCPLGRYALIMADGDDAVEFLQGQLTLDVSAVTPTQSRIGALLNPKGRMLALVRAIRLGDRLALLLPSELAPQVRSHLSRYVLRARVALTLPDDGYRVYGITLATETDAVAALPRAIDEALAQDDGCLLRVRSAGPVRLLGVFRPGPSASLGGYAGADSSPVQSWYRDDILAGQPEILESSREAFVPQMVNLDLIGGISFDKGCYVGQEIVARTHNLGRIKRRMLGFRATGGAVPVPRSAVVTVDDPDGPAAGHVVRAAAQPGGGCVLLAVLSLDKRGRALALADGTRLEPFALPYAIPELTGTA